MKILIIKHHQINLNNKLVSHRQFEIINTNKY